MFDSFVVTPDKFFIFNDGVFRFLVSNKICGQNPLKTKDEKRVEH